MIYRKLKKYVPKMLHYVWIAIFLALVAAFCIIVSYYYMYDFLKAIIIRKDMEWALKLSLKIIVFLIANTVFYFMSTWFTHKLAFRLETNLKKEGIHHLMKASFAFYDGNESGRVRKIIDDNTGLTHSSVAHLIPDLSTAVFVPVLGMFLSFTIDYRLGILFLFSLILGVVLIQKMMGNQNFMKSYMEAQERMNATAVEYVRGMQVLKVFRTNVKAIKEFYKSVVDYSKLALQYSMSCRKWYVIFQVFFNMVFLLLLFFFYMENTSPKVFLVKFMFYVVFNGILFAAFMKIMYVGMYVFQASSAIEKIENLFEKMKEKEMPKGDIEEIKDYTITFDQVSFGYTDRMIIEDLSLELKAGRTYALVGASGSGKSTLAKLLSGFYPLAKGEIRLGDIPLSAYSSCALAKNIANVFQDAKLFKRSIYDNVKIGNPKASKEEVLRALHLAQCDEILEKFPDRENTKIGAKGVHLSGGEMQRITIARAILKDAGLIIMDEASAGADPENEYELQRALSNLMKGKTVIMIAHRLSSIKDVDEILVVDKGAVIERGSHVQLMEKDSKYKRLQEEYMRANEWRVKL